MAGGKGVAIGKRASIDKAKSIMLGAVCAASLVLGVTIVGIVYFTKVIIFNAKIKATKEEAAASFEAVQSNLKTVKNEIDNLADDEYLGSVTRATLTRECANFKPELLEKIDDELERLNKARECSALRVVVDALPSTLQTAELDKISFNTMASLELLLNWSETNYEGISTSESGESSTSDGSTTSALRPIGISIDLQGSAADINRALSYLESSIRNFDAQSITVSWNDGEDGSRTIELTGQYTAYYSDSSRITTYKKTICANAKNKKCPGDGNIKQDNTGGGE